MTWNDMQGRASRVPPGTRLNGIYEIERQIGAGGMGEVYKGVAIQTGDPVAIKMMLGELVEDEAALALFRKEASALHHLQHDAIVRYYVFTVEPVLERPYLAMEFVDGRSLHEMLADGALSFDAVRSLMKRVASGLQAAHDRGIIHRDVSPDNIIVPLGDVTRAKIIDFGIARSTALGQRTVIGSGFAGKYNYVSPEQLGLFGGDVTAKSDIYSLGLVLCEALTGRPIDMGGSQADIVEKRRKIPDLGAIDMRIRPLLERMLQPDPKDRPESMAAVAAWPLEPFSGPRRSDREATPQMRPERGREEAARRPRWRRLTAAVLLLVIVAGATATYVYYPAHDAGPMPGEQASAPPVLQAPPAPSISPPQGSVAANPPSPPPPPLIANPPTAPLPSTAPSSRPPASPTAEPPPAPPAPKANPTPAPPPPLGPVAGTSTGPGTAPTPSRPELKTEPATPEPRPNAKLSLGPPQGLPPIDGRPPVDSRPRPSAPSLSAVEKIKHFVEQYDGGECFFVLPVAIGETAAALEGFGASTRPFESLDTAFQRAHGFEASIGVRQVTQPQCPAITFLNHVRAENARAPRLQLDSTRLRNGETLTGLVDGYGSRNIELVLVSDGGMVQNVSSLLKQGTDSKSFNIGMRREQLSGSQPQLLIAVASARPLDALRAQGAIEAARFFPAVISEAERTRQALSASGRYFKLEN